MKPKPFSWVNHFRILPQSDSFFDHSGGLFEAIHFLFFPYGRGEGKRKGTPLANDVLQVPCEVPAHNLLPVRLLNALVCFSDWLWDF